MYRKRIPQHNNLSPTSLRITLTLTAFVSGATNQTDKQTQTGSKIRSRRVRPMKPSIRVLHPSMSSFTFYQLFQVFLCSTFFCSYVVFFFFALNFDMGVKSKKHFIENINVNLIPTIMLLTEEGGGDNQLIWSSASGNGEGKRSHPFNPLIELCQDEGEEKTCMCECVSVCVTLQTQHWGGVFLFPLYFISICTLAF